MAKSLRDIISKQTAKDLEGVNKSNVVPGSTGSDPYVDYMPKAKDEQDFVKKHTRAVHADRNGNKEDVYQASNVKYSMTDPKMKYYGHKKGSDEKVYEAKVCEDCGKEPCECDHASEAKPGKGKGMILGGKKKLQEVLTKKTSTGEIISDFIHSKDPKFAGKSKEERKRMALGAYYKMHPEKSKKKMEEELAMPMLEGGKKNKKKDLKKNQDQIAQ